MNRDLIKDYKEVRKLHVFVTREQALYIKENITALYEHLQDQFKLKFVEAIPSDIEETEYKFQEIHPAFFPFLFQFNFRVESTTHISGKHNVTKRKLYDEIADELEYNFFYIEIENEVLELQLSEELKAFIEQKYSVTVNYVKDVVRSRNIVASNETHTVVSVLQFIESYADSYTIESDTEEIFLFIKELALPDYSNVFSHPHKAMLLEGYQ